MRSVFPGYYSPTEREFVKLWADGLIVLDTNVLLYLYKVPSSTRKDLLALLRELKSRIWIPFHVALEFQRNRLAVISTERKALQDALQESNSSLEAITKRIGALDLDKRDIGVSSQGLLENLSIAHKAIAEAIQQAQRKQLEVSHQDPVREELDEILVGRIGKPPQNQKELDQLVADGDLRIERKIPPGFKDAGKDNSNEGSFAAGGLYYEKKFGDLILWRQLMSHLKTESVKHVIFVTEDNKDDWWLRLQGMTMGPHPELVAELKKESGVEHAWCYSLLQFIEHANGRIAKSKVSADSVNEVRQAVEKTEAKLKYQALKKFSESNWHWNSQGENSRPYGYFGIENALMPVQLWLLRLGMPTSVNRDGFPDLKGETPIPLGVEVGYSDKFDFYRSQKSTTALSRGRALMDGGDLAAFFLIIVLEVGCIRNRSAGEVQRALHEASSLAAQFGVTGIYVGAIVEGVFELLSDELVVRVGIG